MKSLVNNKDPRSEVPIANFEQVNTSWVNINSGWLPIIFLKNKLYSRLLFQLFSIKLAFNPSLLKYSNSIVNDL